MLGRRADRDRFVNERGGVAGKYKVVPINADSQSKADVAINEVERLIGQEKVEIINGVYASAHAVPLSAKVEAQKKILWITTAIATAVFKDKNLQYVFRGQIHSDQGGVRLLPRRERQGETRQGAEGRQGRDHPRGRALWGRRGRGQRALGKDKGLQLVLREGYSATAPDLSSLVTKLKRAGADVISHCGYNPDIRCSCGRRARAACASRCWSATAPATASSTSCARRSARTSTISATSIQCRRNCSTPPLAPGLGDLIKTMVERYKAKTNATDVPPHCSMGFNQTWVLLNNVLPVAKEKYGGFDAEAVRKAALDVDIAPGGTIQGYGVKFFPPGAQLAGQNERSTPVVMQNAGEHISVVWPSNIKTQEPVLPLPTSSIYAMLC